MRFSQITNMNTLTNLLLSEGYTRTTKPLSEPLIIHAVAGAGKSTLIRKLLAQSDTYRAHTNGPPDPPTPACTSIIPFTSNPPQHTFNILDEYPIGQSKGYKALFADILQHRNNHQSPHFIKTISHRLGPSTAKLIRETLNIPLEGTGEAELKSILPVLGSPLFGTLTALTPEVAAFINDHGAKFYCPDQVLGLEFPVVTVLSTLPLTSLPDQSATYIALSRHTQELHVRSPDPPYPTP
uniref:TGB1 n=1 Tax=Clover yellow mosaic virus TaxID=12177 RepID=A0A7D5ZUS3_CYMV|nr:TGB1 [Clover yellow mosaic virus]